MNIVAWTGHRPQDLPIRYPEFAELMRGRYAPDTHFITGGALGIDTYAAEWAIAHDIPFTLILPFSIPTMTKFWRYEDAQRLRLVHAHKAEKVIIIGGDIYDIRLYQQRNEAMVDRAHEVWTYWTGKRHGGTANCIRYALKEGKPIFNLRTGSFVKEM